jgi:hypothetical protein
MKRSKLISAAFVRLYATALGVAPPEAQAGALCPVPSVGTWPFSTCPIGIPDSIDDEAVSVEEDQWFRSDSCHQVGSDEFCAFTQPSFDAGRGIALVTTAEILQKMASLPIFTEKKLQRIASQPFTTPAYRDEQIPGKGIGLVAVRPLGNNEQFLRRMPIVMVDDIAFKRLGRASLTDLLTQAIGDLPEAHQVDYLNLTAHVEVENHQDRVYEIFMKNDFVVAVEGIADFHSVFSQSECLSSSDGLNRRRA